MKKMGFKLLIKNHLNQFACNVQNAFESFYYKRAKDRFYETEKLELKGLKLDFGNKRKRG